MQLFSLMKEATRIQALYYLLGLVVSVGTASVVLHVKAEVAEVKILLLETLQRHSSEEEQRYTTRREFENLTVRVTEVERRMR